MNSISHDPRYCNSGTIFKGFDPTQAEREARQRQDALAEAHPMTWGWTLSHWDDKERAVYSQGPFELRYVVEKNGWFVAPAGSDDGDIYPDWPVLEVTAELGLIEVAQ